MTVYQLVEGFRSKEQTSSKVAATDRGEVG